MNKKQKVVDLAGAESGDDEGTDVEPTFDNVDETTDLSPIPTFQESERRKHKGAEAVKAAPPPSSEGGAKKKVVKLEDLIRGSYKQPEFKLAIRDEVTNAIRGKHLKGLIDNGVRVATAENFKNLGDTIHGEFQSLKRMIDRGFARNAAQAAWTPENLRTNHPKRYQRLDGELEKLNERIQTAAQVMCAGCGMGPSSFPRRSVKLSPAHRLSEEHLRDVVYTDAQEEINAGNVCLRCMACAFHPRCMALYLAAHQQGILNSRPTCNVADIWKSAEGKIINPRKKSNETETTDTSAEVAVGASESSYSTSTSCNNSAAIQEGGAKKEKKRKRKRDDRKPKSETPCKFWTTKTGCNMSAENCPFSHADAGGHAASRMFTPAKTASDNAPTATKTPTPGFSVLVLREDRKAVSGSHLRGERRREGDERVDEHLRRYEGDIGEM